MKLNALTHKDLKRIRSGVTGYRVRVYYTRSLSNRFELQVSCGEVRFIGARRLVALFPGSNGTAIFMRAGELDFIHEISVRDFLGWSPSSRAFFSRRAAARFVAALRSRDCGYPGVTAALIHARSHAEECEMMDEWYSQEAWSTP